MPSVDNAHALVIGIADYQHIRKLPRVQDAQAIASLLKDPQRCGFPATNVQLLEEEHATRPAISGALAALRERANASSTVVIYFSGHGGRIEEGELAGQYLLPVDTVYPADADLARTALSGTEFAAALRAIPARKVLVILDCCHAGGIGETK